MLAILLLSPLVISVATALLVLTGMSHEAARFQGHSAFTGVRLTTAEAEAEAVVAHPRRRRIVQRLVLLGKRRACHCHRLGRGLLRRRLARRGK